MLSLLLHLYQPSYQDKQIFKRVADESYIPLIRFLKANKNFKVTLNTPLSFLELLDKYGYNSLINDLHFLLDRQQIELVGSGAYHPLLTKIPSTIAEKEIILNEYGLGYYFGRRQGFEGENAILISNINGFFPPELAVNNSVLHLLDYLGYKWVVVDQAAVLREAASSVYSITDLSIKVMVRNTALSNMLAFSRSSNIPELKDVLVNTQNHIIALDGETFGHHNKSGINLLYSLTEVLSSINMTTATFSEYISAITAPTIAGVAESSWSSTCLSAEVLDPYPLWISSSNEVQQKQWLLLNSLNRDYIVSQDILQDDQYANKALWDIESVLNDIKDVNIAQKVVKEVYLMKLQNSDQFFWSSGMTMPHGEYLYDKSMLERSLDCYSNLLALSPDGIDITVFEKNILELRQMIK